MSGGSNSGDSSSRPLKAWERKEIFDQGLWGVASTMGEMPKLFGPNGWQYSDTNLFAKYQKPEYTEAGPARSLSGGDYDRLEKSITDSRWAPLQRYESQVRDMTDEDLNKRGIWSSGVATQAQGDVTEQFAPQYAAAGAEAAAQRYGMQAQEQQMLNALDANEAARRTGYDANVADMEYASKWAPLEYLMGLYNQTGGTISKGSSSGWNFGL